MKDFVKMTLATLAGLLVFGVVSFFLLIGILGSFAAFADKQPVMPREAVLKIDMSSLSLDEQNADPDPKSMIMGGDMTSGIGIWNAVNAINAAALDPAIKFIYLMPDGMNANMANVEELRKALENFRKNSGKAVVAYTENPDNRGYYLASVSDKIYSTEHQGNIITLNGLASQMFFVKDLLDVLGVNVQLIRHGKYKSAGEMFIRNSSSKENLEQNTAMINSLWKTLSTEIAESRNIPVDRLNQIIDNLEIVDAEDMLECGLVDELLTKEELEQTLTDLFVTDKYENVKSISLEDYATLKNKANIKADKKVAVIYANGEIVDGKDKAQVAGDRFAKIIADVRKDSSISAVVLRVNSPGGSVFASEKIKTELDLLKETRPVIASYGDYAASGGYWISANCDYIISDATTLTGSIGVFSMIPDVSKTLSEKLHVNVTNVKSNKHSDMMSLFHTLDPAEIDYMQKSVEDIYTKFTSIVSVGRNKTVSYVDSIAQGRVWTGAEALEIGLVDQIGTLEDAIHYAIGTIDGATGLDDVDIVEFPKPQSTFESLMESISSTDASIFAGTPLENFEKTISYLKDTEKGKVYARMPYEVHIR